MECCICKSSFKKSQAYCLDGYICDACNKKIPSLIDKRNLPVSSLLSWIKDYDNSDEFLKTSSYGDISLDEVHGLFRLETKNHSLFKKNNYDISNTFKLLDLSALSFTLKNIVTKDSLIYADILFSFEMKNKSFSTSFVIKRNVKCDTKRIDNNHLSYTEPATLTIFREVFYQAIKHQLDSINIRLKQLGTNNLSDIQKAKALFMIDKEINDNELRKIRNVLIKAFHPDNSHLDKKYCEKINKAYALLTSTSRSI